VFLPDMVNNDQNLEQPYQIICLQPITHLTQDHQAGLLPGGQVGNQSPARVAFAELLPSRFRTEIPLPELSGLRSFGASRIISSLNYHVDKGVLSLSFLL